tara:strand:- start:301 stop:744 length:444 start_codon:yes stop_codon:yes gene_type:complete
MVGCGQDASEPEPATAPAPAPAPAPATLSRQPSPEGALLYIISPADGAEVQSPVSIAFGLKGAGVAPAGIEFENAGHHHVLVDMELANFSLPIPADANHVHFGLGQTEASLELAPGEHTLQLVLGDHLHIPHDPPLISEQVTITVVE